MTELLEIDGALSPASFAAEVANSLEHRLAKSVVVPATERALNQLRTSNHESWFWSTDNYPPPMYYERGEHSKPSTFSMKSEAFAS